MIEIESSAEGIDVAHYLDVALRRRWVIVSLCALVVLIVTLVTFTTRPVYQANALLDIEKERGGGATTVMANSLIENSNDDYYQTQYKLLQSRSLLQKVYGDLQLSKVEEFKDGVGVLSRSISISPVLRSRLVYVNATSFDPVLAARIANAVGETFVDQNLSNQLFISKEVLQTLQGRNDSAGRAAYEALPAVVNNPLIQTLKGEEAKLESQAAEMSQRFTPKYPEMIALRSNISALQDKIRSETDKIVAAMKTELSGQLHGNNVRIIDPAQAPGFPIRPKKLKAMLMGIIGGLIVGIGGALLIETLDQSIHTQEDVENKLRLPFLGILPLSTAKGQAVYKPLLVKELSLTSEAFRNIRTMIDFAAVNQKSKALLVTSTVQSEGKTYVASNLAVVFAQLGENVLIIDGDLRRPQVHRSFSVSAERGVSDFLATGTSVDEISRYLRETEIPNVKVLPCGPRPPNPSELLNTPRLGALVGWAQANFDRVIVDCTPMFPISDTILWGRHIGSAIFVVNYDRTRTPLVMKASQLVQSGGIKILGAVINRARPSGLSYSSYGYYYQQYYHAYHEEPAVKSS